MDVRTSDHTLAQFILCLVETVLFQRWQRLSMAMGDTDRGPTNSNWAVRALCLASQSAL